MKKTLDPKNRWRSKTVSFRMSPEEAEQLDCLAQLSGMTKQAYIINRVLKKDVVVNGNPRVYKALRNQFQVNYEELKRLEKISDDNTELLELILYSSTILKGLKEGVND